MPVFGIDDVWRPEGRFEARATGALTDPTTVTLQIRTPAGVETTYTYPATVSKSETGVYYKDISITAAGEWSARYVGTGTIEAAVEDSILVPRSRFDTP